MLLGNGLGFWKTMPIRRRRETVSMSGPEISSPSKRISPSIRAPLMRSFMRLKQRSSVLLPQPEGPISAVILFLGISIVRSFTAREGPYQTRRSRLDSTIGSAGSDGIAAGASAVGSAVLRSGLVWKTLIGDLAGLGVRGPVSCSIITSVTVADHDRDGV